ncbi:MAG TPA: heavy metal translocating P-type ATPase [Gemmatimonadales bacterium]|nr:heavy metal translocating P-type ATPase [Gemmatimonadales bacterium]
MKVRADALLSLLIAGAALTALGVEALRYFGALPGRPDSLALLVLIATGLPLVLRTVWGALRGQFAADIVASLAISTAVAFNEPIAGLVVVLMQSGGEFLDRYAEGRASRAVRELEAAAPRIAHRIGDGGIEDVPVETIVAGDRLLVRPGEMIPCDAMIVEGTSHLDTASITGEPLPRRAGPGSRILSGSYNRESPLTVEATARAAESQYARIVELVRTAQASRAPIQRLADRYAVWFTPLTLAVAAVAYGISGDRLRILSVLVVATPCPLILAVPVAIIGGVNRAARRGIVVRNGTALEQVGDVDTVVFDKTGTLTIGQPAVARVAAAPGFTEAELLRLAGAAEQPSSHLLARALTGEAILQVGSLPRPTAAHEEPGRGITATVEGKTVLVGSRAYVTDARPEAEPVFATLARPGRLTAFVSVDGRAAGVVEYEDRIRPEAPETLEALRQLGIEHMVILSGDSIDNVRAVARTLDLEDAQGDLLAEDKVETVAALQRAGRRVLMMGDGTNDAPALERATVGMAIAPREAAITAEAADIVLLADDLRLLPAAIGIGRHSLRIARQSVRVGLGLSGLAMLFAAAGMIPPTVGALIQEAIDISVILNALRSARDPATASARSAEEDSMQEASAAATMQL